MMSDMADKWTQPTEESDGSTLKWKSADVYMHWYVIYGHGIKVEIPVRAPLYAQDTNEAANEKVKHASISLTPL